MGGIFVFFVLVQYVHFISRSSKSRRLRGLCGPNLEDREARE